VYKWFPGNEELDNKITWNGTVTTYSKLTIITEKGYQSDKFHLMFADADDCDMDEESIKRLLCSSGTLDGLRGHGLINRYAWDLAIYLHAVSDTNQYQRMGMECSAAPTVCPCLFGKDCTLTREGTILAAADRYNRAVAEESGATPDSWSGVAEHVSTDKEPEIHTCVCGKGFVSVYALKNHVAEGWVGSSHNRSPECRPRLGIAYVISDVSHPNPYQSVLAAHAMRVVSRSTEDEPSTSVEEQCITAAMSKLNRIAPDKCEALLSSDSLSDLMALKKVCMYCEMTARHGVRTKEAGEPGIATLQIQQMCARGVDFGMMHEAACHNREKNGTTDFGQTVTARQNHSCDLLAGDAAQYGRSHELDFYGGLRPQERATNFVASAGVPLFGDPFEQVGWLAQRTRVTRRLNKESRQPECQRSKATRVMRLMEK